MKVDKLIGHRSLIQPQPSCCCGIPSNYKNESRGAGELLTWDMNAFAMMCCGSLSLLHAFVSFAACCLLADVWMCLVQVLL